MVDSNAARSLQLFHVHLSDTPKIKECELNFHNFSRNKKFMTKILYSKVLKQNFTIYSVHVCVKINTFVVFVYYMYMYINIFSIGLHELNFSLFVFFPTCAL